MPINPLTGLEEEETPQMNPTVRDYLLKRKAEREAVEKDVKEYDSLPNISAALAALGAGFQKRDSAAAGNAVLERQNKQNRAKLSDFDLATDRSTREIGAVNMDDPMSGDSVAMQEQIGSLFPTMKNAVAGKSKAQIQQMLPLLSAKIRGDQDRENARITAGSKLTEKRDAAEAKRKDEEEKAKSPDEIFKKLPMDNQVTIKDLSGQNAKKLGIKNQIDAVMSAWDGLTDDQKIARGGQLLKTLNSSEGADAIGAEEAARLGAKLEYAMGNLSPFNSKPIQFGRDLKGFAEQARGTAKSMGDAISANQAIIDQAYGRPGMPPKEETKIVGGVTYRKVPGGWEELPMPASR